MSKARVAAPQGTLPLTDKAAALEFFNLMLDTMLGETAGDGAMWPDLRRNLQ